MMADRQRSVDTPDGHLRTFSVASTPAEKERNLAGVSDAGEDPAKVSKTRKISLAIDRFFRKVFYSLAFRVANRPWTVIIICFLVCIASGAGFMRFKPESRTDVQWVPQGTEALENRDISQQYWTGAGFRFERIIFAGKNGEDEDIATKTSLLEMWSAISFLESTTAEFEGRTLTFETQCEPTSNRANQTNCFTTSVLHLFYNPALPNTTFMENVYTTLNTLSDSQIKEKLTVGPFSTWNGAALNTRDIFGGVNGENDSLTIASFKYTAFLKNRLVTIKGDDVDPQSEAWETEWIARALSRTNSGDTVKYVLLAQKSQGDALGDAISGDLRFLIIGYFLLIIYQAVMLGDCNSPVKVRVVLALCAVASSGMAVITTIGLCSALGMWFGSVHQVLPLLLLGLGADLTFVITAAFDELHKDQPIPQKIALALSKAGTAVTITTCTNMIAFGIGASTPLPAVRFFNVWASIGVLLLYFYAITFYVACLSLDARRQANRGWDLLCCVKSKSVPQTGCCGGGLLSRLYGNIYGPLLMKRMVQYAVLAFFVILAGINLYGATQLKQDFKFEYFYPDDSYLVDYSLLQNKYYSTTGPTTSVYTIKAPFETEEVQKKMYELAKPGGLLASNEYVIPSTVDSWYMAMRNAYRLSEGQYFASNEFYPKLNQFLRTNGSRYFRDLNFSDPSGSSLSAARVSATYIFLETNDIEVKAMRAVREVVKDSELPNSFAFSYSDIFTEQYAIIPMDAAIAVAIALVTVGIVTLLLIGHPLVSLIVVISVAFVVVNLLGVLHYWDININSVSVTNLVLAIGVSIDYSGLIGIAFMNQVGDRKKRVVDALRSMGPPLTHGATSIFLAIVLLSVAQSYIFRVLFRMYFLIIVFGIGHGLILVPTLLAIFGPKVGFFSSERERDAAEEKLETEVAKKTGQGLSLKNGNGESPVVGDQHDFLQVGDERGGRPV